jgi:hypothetical protein
MLKTPSILTNLLCCGLSLVMSKKTNAPIEDDFSAAVRKAYSGWIERVEKAKGTTEGFPDLVLLMPSGLELAELKVGSVIDGVLWCNEVRPSQIRFHTDLANKGGRSFFLAGVWKGGESRKFNEPSNWSAYAFDSILARHWHETGFKVGETAFEIDMMDLNQSLTDFVFEQLEN